MADAEQEQARPHWEDVVERSIDQLLTLVREGDTAAHRELVRRLLDFEASVRRDDPAREHRIRTELHISPARYTQLLNSAIDTQAAQEHNPRLVGSLRFLREMNRANRAQRYEAPEDGK